MQTTASWLTTFANDSLGPLRLTPQLDRRLNRRALAARSSPAVRDRLFIDLSATIAHWLRHYRGWRLAPWEFDDILQESYLTFVELLDRWHARIIVGPSGQADPRFAPYFLRNYPLLLANRVAALRLASRARPLGDWGSERGDELPDPWAAEADVRAALLIEAICARLSVRDAHTLRLIVAADYSIGAVARQTGLPPRTLYHRWARITATARAVILGQETARQPPAAGRRGLQASAGGCAERIERCG